MFEDIPKSLGNMKVREERHRLLEMPHIAPLTSFVHALREEMGSDYAIPYFDPLDGGIVAPMLFLLEAPGPKAVASGFISRNNPDETAKNTFLLTKEAGIDRKSTVLWNVVPWYIGSGSKIRPATIQDIKPALDSLRLLLSMLTKLQSIVLVGCKAALVESDVRRMHPAIKVFKISHPSPLFVNRLPGNREKLLEEIKRVAHAEIQL
ncbi:uracil-DNA glycosylase [Chlorobium phaeobacteroides]|uniref:Uracil-DNA glycosylase-like domain-containing protein n=1 Tax=Chlorobium phaeobacteroides (strain DSM 266 / SMG 266 / 2430) TaxID=290317 RepID=A1BGW1_CHLPD|nr:uracil-DNA glycosylase [Chlorobium phaeobacteroides]ABL65638.1 conserved hypothetical protein [Chlorobium phaeobacteroides DSM 266]